MRHYQIFYFCPFWKLAVEVQLLQDALWPLLLHCITWESMNCGWEVDQSDLRSDFLSLNTGTRKSGLLSATDFGFHPKRSDELSFTLKRAQIKVLDQWKPTTVHTTGQSGLGSTWRHSWGKWIQGMTSKNQTITSSFLLSWPNVVFISEYVFLCWWHCAVDSSRSWIICSV